MLDTKLSLYTLNFRRSSIRIHATHEAALAKAKEVAERAGRSVKLVSAEGKWLVLPGSTARLDGSWKGSRVSKGSAAWETEICRRNCEAVVARCLKVRAGEKAA